MTFTDGFIAMECPTGRQILQHAIFVTCCSWIVNINVFSILNVLILVRNLYLFLRILGQGNSESNFNWVSSLRNNAGFTIDGWRMLGIFY